MRLLIVSHDVVGTRMAGPGIRYWELARALTERLNVCLIAPQPIDLQWPGLTTGNYHWGDADSLSGYTASADVILANGYILDAHPELAACSRPLILDLYDPTLLENLELLRSRPETERLAQHQRDVALLQRQLAAGDFFLCATERQRDLYIGALLATGRITPAYTDADPQLRRLIAVLPSGLPAEPPVHTAPALRGVIEGVGPDDPLVLWYGGMWDWMDPLTLIRAVPAVLKEIPDLRVVFMAGAHPGAVTPPQAPSQARTLAEALGLLGRHVFFYDEWAPYPQRGNFLLEATVAVSLHRQGLETAYAALRSRILDCFWAGLPVVWSDGDQAAVLVREHGCGMVVPPEDPTAVATALATLLSNPTLRAEQATRARSLAPRFAWPTLVSPILEWIATRPASSKTVTHTHMKDSSSSKLPPTDVTLVERSQLLLDTRNAALQALDRTWRLDNLSVPATGRLGHLRRLLMDRVVWPLLYPLLARQQEQNAATIRAFYAVAEYSDSLSLHLQHLHSRLDYLQQQLELVQLRLEHLQQQVEHTQLQLQHHFEHAQLRLDHLQQGLVELNERTVRERHILSQQVRDFAGQLAGLEEAEIQIRAMLRGDPVPPPREEPS